MAKRPRRNHTAAFEAKVALEAVEEERAASLKNAVPLGLRQLLPVVLNHVFPTILQESSSSRLLPAFLARAQPY